ncbi:DUF1642 domain-containing protein [Lactiplantibacillus pentosus]|uniref:DUF1642 domain-containing protein n=1 Tax=Lactiplantibacillus TaxID=2767842 RepID=UPI00080FB3F3|nr:MULTISPECIES: DUF1642 domain-containing protein [Lactiplantibacillus]MBU7497302.1 DUF1642 domain-containing protein [Lactiplantibacillus pentosus]WDT51392.1 DUF1642 domain-containing protein [Lactiplantibacillus plantarum]WNN86517.1 DUF1642 domain-containing protein [Lactiplantibacillus pentosus]
MKNETKRDVFEKALREWDNLVHSCGLQGEEAHGGCEFDPILIKYRKDYDAALPDDLPVIPQVWADTIERFKANHYGLDEILTEWDWNYDEQELIARAWLDGYTVEEDK